MMKRFYIIILFLAFVLKVSSQVYPVSVMVNLTPPYPSTLDGFADISSNKISLQITVNDLTLSGYPVKLRLVMKSNSVTITTSQAFITNPILINGGESIILTSADLAEYFRLENLDFSGFSKNQYLKTGQLPDGIYQITFEVVDYHRNFVISSSRFPAFAYIFVNDPPILNMPFDRAQINITGQQNILFNWTFRHSPFSRPGFIPEYRFEMWEVYPENMDPYAVALATQPVYSTTVNSTTFNYTVMEPSLIPGRKYAWRVTVIDPEGITAFKEGGRSALRWFQYGTACDAPLIKAGAIGASHINVEWETKQYQTNFKINYKPVNMESGDWYSGTTSMQNFRIENLRPNTEYYVEVKGTCGTQESPASERLRLRTKQDLTFECGNPGNIPEITNRNPLMQLKRGDYIKAGDFEVEIYEAQGSNGTFSGKGFILVPLFKFIKLEADLNNIHVNTDYQLMGGSIKTVYNLSNSLMLNMTDIFGGGSLMKKENNPFADIADIKINAPDSIQSVIISGNSVVVNTAQGTVTESVSEDKIVAITAPSGKQYVVDGATKTVYAQSTPSGAAPSKGVDGLKQPSDSEKKFVVDFDASGQQIYGFDKPDVQNMPADNYKTRITNGQMAYVPWKSVESGRFDRLDAIINGEPADSVFFSRQSRNMVMVSKGTDDSRRSLLISGGNNNDEDELYAWYTYNGNEQDTNKNIYYAGSVNIVSYDQISSDLCLVSVNGSAVPADKAAVEAFLNKVYASAVAKWNVTYLEGGLSVTLESGSGKKIDNTDPDDRMDYTPDMKLVNRAMKDHPAYNRHTVYLFFFDQGTDDAASGYMPLNGQFGYITGFTAAKQAEYYRTIAHEVAHGVFNLRHTFSHENNYVLSEGSTDNLLDYNGGTALYKYQWDLIHDPEKIWFAWLEEEGEGAEKIKTFLSYINNRIKEISAKNPAVLLGVVHCEECNLPIESENIKSKEIKLRDNASGTIYYDSERQCIALFYHPGDGAKILFGEMKLRGIDGLDLLNESKKQLTVILDGDITLNCNQYITTSLTNYFKCRGSIEEDLDEEYFTELFNQVDECINAHLEQINKELSDGSISIPYTNTIDIKAVEEDLKAKLSETIFADVKFSVQLSDDNNYSQNFYSIGVGSVEESEIRLQFHVNHKQKRLFASIDVSDNYLAEYESKLNQRAINKGIDVDVSELRHEVIKDIKEGFELMTKHLTQQGYNIPTVGERFLENNLDFQAIIDKHLNELQKSSSDYFASLKMNTVIVSDDILSAIEISDINLEEENLGEKTQGSGNENLYAGEILKFWQVAQLNVKHIWNEGTMHPGTWHSNDPKSEAYKFPEYAKFGPMPVGACDAIIDEIMGISLIIKTGYQLMTDKQQRQALGQIFTREGFNSLINSLKDEISNTLTDDQLLTYGGTKLTTSVTFSLVTGGGNLLIKGGRKLFETLDILEGLAQKFKNCPKLTSYISRLQKSGQKLGDEIGKIAALSDKVGAEQLEKLAKQTDDISNAVNNLDELIKKFDALDIENALKHIPEKELDIILKRIAKFKDCDGIEKVLKTLGSSPRQSIGAKFVLEYADNFEASAVKFEVEELIETTTEQGEKLVTRRYDAVIHGVKHEMKCWREWQGWSDNVIQNQFVRDLSNPKLEKLEDLQWVFKKTDGITDDVLKDKIIGALESKAGKEALQKAFDANTQQFQKLFGNRVYDANDIISKLKSKELFDKIFQVYE